MALPESSSPLDYLILTPSVSFISLYILFEVGAIFADIQLILNELFLSVAYLLNVSG